MIDIESQVYTALVKVLRAQFPTLTVSGEYLKVPPSFPYVSIEQTDSYDIKRFMTNDLSETPVQLLYEINIFSNKTTGKKSECKSILKSVDDVLRLMNFQRECAIPVPNLEDGTVYRIVARYRVKTDGRLLYR